MSQTETVVEATPEVEAPKTSKAKVEKTGNLIHDIASEVESMSKTKVLNELDRLAESIDVNYFKMGGILKRVKENSWFEGHDSFDAFVQNKYGFAPRKAAYLISIYDNLVTKQIPWEKVADLGWTKLKDLAPHLTPENVDEWVEKAKSLTVTELQLLLKSQQPSEEGEKTAKTTDEVVKMAFKFKGDQAAIVTQALAKAKGELNTEYDTVALENICASYVGGNIAVASAPSIQAVLAAAKPEDFEAIMTAVADKFDSQWDITVAEKTAK